MNVFAIPLSLNLANPPQFAGTYAAQNSWSWYAPGAQKDVWPHFTIQREGLEWDPNTDEWKGFHISIPISSGRSATNIQRQYLIKRGNVKFANYAKAGLTEANLVAAEKDDAKNAMIYQAMAEAFYRAALAGATEAARAQSQIAIRKGLLKIKSAVLNAPRADAD
jgi:hypothetical protein